MRPNFKTLLGFAVACALAGCNVGEAPSGSEQAVRDQLAAKSPQDQIKFIQDSPLSPAQKQQKIEEIKKKTGYTGDASSSATPPNQTPQHG